MHEIERCPMSLDCPLSSLPTFVSHMKNPVSIFICHSKPEPALIHAAGICTFCQRIDWNLLSAWFLLYTTNPHAVLPWHVLPGKLSLHAVGIQGLPDLGIVLP